MAREIEEHPDPDEIWDYLKKIDSRMFEIEGDTFDGLYMYYKGRYLYSWDTPYSEYEDTGYAATSRPWYTDAVKGNGQIEMCIRDSSSSRSGYSRAGKPSIVGFLGPVQGLSLIHI